jgi:Fe-S-cluster containining protein
MSIFSPILSADSETINVFSGKIKDLFGRMGRAYDTAASCCGFSCRGCDENCCEERFHHHTLSEFLYLSEGIRSCDGQTRRDIFSRSHEVMQLYRMHDEEGAARRVMCPLNVDGLCCIYEHRPMICRLHGVPHITRRPDGTETLGTGCHKAGWDTSSRKDPECMLDRTDLYRELSAIEIGLRQRLGFGYRIRMTIAEMITDIEKLLAAAR